jgi:hypothetical protein
MDRMHYALYLFINQYELWPVGYETDFSEDEQKTDELPTEEKASFFFAKEASCF